MRIVLMGPPGAGKGTQAKKLTEKFGLRHLSSGDLLRAEKAAGTPLGRKLVEYMDAGQLVPDDIVVDVMAAAMSADDVSGLLLDGFPRTVAQAEALDAQLDKAGVALDAVIVIDASEDVIVGRITGRRSCPKCGRIYHEVNMPPATPGVCDDCGAALVQRDDDRETVVRRRLEAYRRQTEPVIAYYRTRKGVKMIEVDGSGDPETVSATLAARLEPLTAGRK